MRASALAIRDAIRLLDSFNLIHLKTAFKVDVFLLARSDYAQAAFARRQLDTMVESEGARTFYFAAPEDVLLHKLYWFRLGGEVSERQWGDVLGVLRVQREALDDAYLRRWASELEVTDLLDRSKAEAGFGA
ncbi:MAG: hypothetical protein IH897_13955 [Planctomycetes bacterium]|nr:hypothetical protein [Planctomycetota bacterium]